MLTSQLTFDLRAPKIHWNVQQCKFVYSNTIELLAWPGPSQKLLEWFSDVKIKKLVSCPSVYLIWSAVCEHSHIFSQTFGCWKMRRKEPNTLNLFKSQVFLSWEFSRVTWSTLFTSVQFICMSTTWMKQLIKNNKAKRINRNVTNTWNLKIHSFCLYKM